MLGSRIVEPLEAYLDASTTDHGKPTQVLTLAVVVASARRWREFEIAWAAAMKRGGAEGKILHMTDLMAGRKAFEGWTNEMREPLFRELVPVVEEHVVVGLCGSFPVRYFAEALPEFPERDPSRALFELALQGLLQVLIARVRPSKDQPITCFMENDRATDARATRQFYHLTAQLSSEGWEDFFPSITPLPKGLGSLQAADMVAYEGSRYASEHKVRTPTRPPRRLVEELQRTGKIFFSTIGREPMRELAAKIRGGLATSLANPELKASMDETFAAAQKRMQSEFSERSRRAREAATNK